MNVGLRALAGLAGLVLLVGLGCNKKSDTGSAPPPTGTTTQNTAAAGSGAELYQQHCVKCHRPGGKGKSAPDLSKLSSDPSRTAEWITEHIKDPKIHTPESRMPSFEGKLDPEQMRKLAEYILSLKS